MVREWVGGLCVCALQLPMVAQPIPSLCSYSFRPGPLLPSEMQAWMEIRMVSRTLNVAAAPLPPVEIEQVHPTPISGILYLPVKIKALDQTGHQLSTKMVTQPSRL